MFVKFAITLAVLNIVGILYEYKLLKAANEFSSKKRDSDRIGVYMDDWDLEMIRKWSLHELLNPTKAKVNLAICIFSELVFIYIIIISLWNH